MTPFHLDDESLSAALDGQATSDDQAHLDGCSSCRERLDGLRSVALAVGTPVPGRPQAAVEAAILSALQTAPGPDRVQAPLVLPWPSETVSSPGGRRGAWPRRAGPPHSRPGHRPGDVRGRRFAELALATAAMAAVVLGVGLLARGSGRGSAAKVSTATAGRGVALAPNATSAGAAAPPSATLAAPGSSSKVPSAASAAGPGGVVSGADLGDQSDPGALARIVDARLAAQAPKTSPELPTATPLPMTCVNQGAATVGAAGRPVVLRYMAPVRWQGQDAVVLVYARPAGGLAGVVMRRRDCASLATLPL